MIYHRVASGRKLPATKRGGATDGTPTRSRLWAVCNGNLGRCIQAVPALRPARRGCRRNPMERNIQALLGSIVARYEAHDLDGQPDFSIWLPGIDKPLRAECKNIRESSKAGGEAYREGGKIVAYKVETQKTAHRRAMRPAATTAWINLKFSAFAWGRKPESGPTSFLPRSPIYSGTRSIRINWRFFSGIRCPLPSIFSRGTMISASC